jgi:hypothetical protein
MPYIKVLHRRKFKKHYGNRTVDNLKFLLAILFLSLIAGRAALYVSEIMSNKNNSQSVIENKIKEQLIKEYAEGSKEDWKKSIDEKTKQELKEKYGDLIKQAGY